MTISHLVSNRTVKVMSIGFPKTGKTGSLACLANAGYNLRIVDLDGNYAPLLEYVEPEFYDNIHILSCRDKEKINSKGFRQTIGNPHAFEKALRLFDSFKYTDQHTGEEFDFGPVHSWGPNDVFITDSGTNLGEASMRNVLHHQGRNGQARRIQDWGLAMEALDMYCEMVGDPDIPCHVLVTFHKKLIGPKDILPTDSAEIKEQKEKVQEVVPFRWFPSALGRELAPKISRHMPYLLHYESVRKAGRMQRLISTMATEDTDAGVPIKDLPSQLPMETGLLTIFEAVKGK